MIRVYGEIEGKKKFDLANKIRAYKASRNYYIDKYGKEKGNELYNERIRKSMVKAGRASKESLKVLLNDLIDICDKLKIKYYVGIDGNKEYFLKNKKIYFYDFTIPSLNIIVEYHSSFWHYNIRKPMYNNLLNCNTIDFSEKDMIKKELAIQKGFEYFEVFDDEVDNKKPIIIKRIKDKYEKINE